VSQTGLCDDRHRRADIEAGRSTTDIAEEAKDALIAQGTVVIPGLAAALPGLDRFGKLSAIEVFAAYGDRGAGPALVGLLSDADTTVREWAANALGELGYTEAGPALARLNARLLREMVRPDFTEPVAVRSVLTLFGLRRRVTPDLTRTLARDTGHGQAWPVARLPEVLPDLASVRSRPAVLDSARGCWLGLRLLAPVASERRRRPRFRPA
jgi:hypothetical protein